MKVNGTELFHTSIGSGTPILFMHGGLGLDHAYFRPTLDSWADFAELHFYDHRGKRCCRKLGNQPKIHLNYDSCIIRHRSLHESIQTGAM